MSHAAAEMGLDSAGGQGAFSFFRSAPPKSSQSNAGNSCCALLDAQPVTAPQGSMDTLRLPTETWKGGVSSRVEAWNAKAL